MEREKIRDIISSQTTDYVEYHDCFLVRSTPELDFVKIPLEQYADTWRGGAKFILIALVPWETEEDLYEMEKWYNVGQ